MDNDPSPDPHEDGASVEQTFEPEDRARLALGLRAWAQGDPHLTAAVELLIWHGDWLDREDFREHVHVQTQDDGEDLAVIDWRSLGGMRMSGGLHASSSAVTVLDTVLGLVVPQYPYQLTDLTKLGVNHMAAVVQALIRAAGHHDRITIHTQARDEDLPPFLREG